MQRKITRVKFLKKLSFKPNVQFYPNCYSKLSKFTSHLQGIIQKFWENGGLKEFGKIKASS